MKIKRPSKEHINELDAFLYEGPIRLVRTPRDVQRMYMDIRQEEDHAVGFDTESVPTHRKGQQNRPPCLVQISTQYNAWIVQLSFFRFHLPKELVHLIEDQNVKKIGVALKMDIDNLHRIQDFCPQNMVSIEKEYEKCGFEANGLRTLFASVYEKRISKSLRLSEWSKKYLTLAQMRYAATDAWCSLKLWKDLEKIRNGEKIPLPLVSD